MTQRVPKIVVVGTCYVDMAVKCSQIPAPGGTLLGNGFSCNCAGGGVNQSIAAVQCGCGVSLIGKIGSDCFSDMISSFLAEKNVDISFLDVADAKNTGTSMTFVNSDGENATVFSPGANSAISPEFIESIPVEQLIASCDACLIDAALPSKVISAAINMAEMRGTKSLLTIKLDSDETARCMGNLPENYKYVDILVVEVEDYSSFDKVVPSNMQLISRVGANLVSQGFETVVINTGKREVHIFNRDGVGRVKSYELEIVDRSCSQDSFAAALAASIASGDNIERAVSFANAAFAITASRYGYQESLPTKEEIIKLLLERND